MIKKSYKTKRLLLIQPNIDMTPEIVNFYLRNKNFFKEYDPLRPESFYNLTTHKKSLSRNLKKRNSAEC